MNQKWLLTLTLTITWAALSFCAAAQQVKEPRTTADWEAPYPPFRIAGNLYYVGTKDLACYLVTTSHGNMLINTGLAASYQQISDNIASLGFQFSDTKILLTNQAHYDHMGAMAKIKATTGAQLMVDAADAEVLESGGAKDYELGKYGVSFQPVVADRLLQDGDTIRLGDQRIKLLHHPGHTKGSCSFLLNVQDDSRSYTVLIANMPSIIVEGSLRDVRAYPNIAEDYAYTFNNMKNISFDIWLAAHASQFGLHKKHQPGDAYHPAVFIDQKGYDKAVADLKKTYDDAMQQK